MSWWGAAPLVDQSSWWEDAPQIAPDPLPLGSSSLGQADPFAAGPLGAEIPTARAFIAPTLPQPLAGTGEAIAAELSTVPQRFKRAAGGVLRSAGLVEAPPDLEAPANNQSALAMQLNALARHSGQTPTDLVAAASDNPLMRTGTELFKEASDAIAARSLSTVPSGPTFGPDAAGGPLPVVEQDTGTDYLRHIAGGAANMLPALLASLASRNANLGISLLSGQVAGEKFGESSTTGRTFGQSAQDAWVHALSEGLSELTPLGILTRPGRTALSRIGKATGAEAIQEAVNGVVQDLYDAGVLNEQIIPRELAVNAVRNFIVGGGIGGGLATLTAPFVRRDGAAQQDRPPATQTEAAQRQALRDAISGTVAAQDEPYAGPPPGAESGRTQAQAPPQAARPGIGGILPVEPLPSVAAPVPRETDRAQAPGGTQTTVYTPAGEGIQIQYGVMPGELVIASHGPGGAPDPRYPSERQPRQRERAASQAQIQRIAGQLNPVLLGESPTTTDGAPIVDDDPRGFAIVESGNARTAAIALAYRQHPEQAAAYKQYLIANAERFGLDPQEVARIQQPVLVRRRLSQVDPVEFARQSNQPTVAQMAPAEQARVDAERLTDEDIAQFAPDEAGNVLAASNVAFNRAFLQRLGGNEAGALVTGDGRLNKAGADRIRAAIFAKAYQDDRLVNLAAEEADPDVRNILNGLQAAAPAFARARAAGALGDLDAVTPLIGAIEFIRDARRRGIPVGPALRQGSVFEQTDPLVGELVELLQANIRSGKRIGQFLKSLGSAIEQELIGRRSGSLFDDSAVTAREVVSATRQRFEQEPGGAEQPLFRRSGQDATAPVDTRFDRRREPRATGRTETQDTDQPDEQLSATVASMVEAMAKESLGIERAEMPQIRRDDQPEFFRQLDADGIDHRERGIAAGELRGMQRELDPAKVAAMAQTLRSGRPLGRQGTLAADEAATPMIASSDGYILDGHHRWAAQRVVDPSEPMRVVEVALTAQDLLDRARAFTSQGGVNADFIGRLPYRDIPQPLPDNHALLQQTHTKPGREGLQQHIRRTFMHRAKMPLKGQRPVAIIIGGGTAAGKSSARAQMAQAGLMIDTVVIDQDEIKNHIPEYHEVLAERDGRAAAVVHEESGQIADQLIKDLVRERANIIIDRTMKTSAKGVALMEDLVGQGYEVRLLGVTSDIDAAIDRAQARAALTWRFVPPEVVREAHQGFSRGWEQYVSLADEVNLYDTNGHGNAQLIARGRGGRIEILDQAAYNAFRSKANAETRETIGRFPAAAGVDEDQAAAGSARFARSDQEGARTGQAAAGQDVLPSRRLATLGVQQLRDWLAGVEAAHPNAPRPHVITSQAATTELGFAFGTVIQDVPSNAMAFVRNGEIWLLADRIDSKREALRTYFHEAVGHAGVRALYPDLRIFNRMLDDVFDANRARVEALARRLDFDLSNVDERRVATEEYIAETAERSATVPAWLDRIIVQIANILRRLGIEWRRAEIIELVRRARTTAATPTQPGGEQRFARRSQEQSPQQPTRFRRGGEETAAARLEKAAAGLDSQIERNESPAIAEQNPTARRTRIAGHMWDRAQSMRRTQAALRAMAARIRANNLDPAIVKFSSRAAVDQLRIAAEHSARWPQAKPDYEQWQRDRVQEMQAEWGKYGITTAAQFDAAQRAFIALDSQPVEDQAGKQLKLIRDKEVALIGRKIPGWFPTPEAVAREMVHLADIGLGMTVLEPSAGNGAIALEIRAAASDANLRLIEINNELADILDAKGFDSVERGDFLEHKTKYDRIIMNPPFERGQDVDHVRHAFDLLKPGGRLVAIMGEHAFFAADKKSQGFRGWLSEKQPGGEATVQRLQGAFKESKLRTTGANARMVVLQKPQDQPKGEQLPLFRRAASRPNVGPYKWAPGERLYQRLEQLAVPILDRVGLAKDVPETYRLMLRRFRAEITDKARQAGSIAELGGVLARTERELISDYMERELKAGVIPPADVIEIAAQMQAAIEAQSKELIDLGMLDESTVARWAGKYLPRYYAKTDQPGIPRELRRVFKRIDGNHFKGRGQFEFVRKGDIKQWQQLGWEIRNPEEDTQEVIAKLRDADKVLMWRDFSRDERAGLGEIRDAIYRFTRGFMETGRDLAIGRLFKSMAEDPDISSPRQVADDQVQVPDTQVPGTGVYRYGAMHGRWVSRTIWDDLQHVSDPNPDSELHRLYMKALSLWKEGKTALNPVVHGNNIWSSMVMADLYGIPFYRVDKYAAALRDYSNKGEFYREGIKHGLFGTEFYGTEIAQIMPELSELKNIETAAAGKLRKLIGWTAKATGASAYRRRMGHWYRAEDQFYKLMIYKDMRERGASIDRAIDEAERWIFNYADVPRGVRFIKNAPIGLPFFSYTYKAAPALLYAGMTRPWAYAKWVALFAGANWMSYTALFGPDHDDQEERERKLLPEFMRGITPFFTDKALRWPFDRRSGLASFLDLSRRWPLGDLFDANNQLGGVGILQPLMPNNPVFTTAMAMMVNRDSFSGREVVRKTDTASEQLKRRAQWLAYQALPNTPLLPFSYSFDKVMTGVANATGANPDNPFTFIGLREYTGRNYYGDEQDLARALLSTVAGWKIREVDLDREHVRQMGDLRRELNELRGQARSLSRNQTVPTNVRQAEMEKIRQKVADIRRRAAEVPKP